LIFYAFCQGVGISGAGGYFFNLAHGTFRVTNKFLTNVVRDTWSATRKAILVKQNLHM